VGDDEKLPRVEIGMERPSLGRCKRREQEEANQK